MPRCRAAWNGCGSTWESDLKENRNMNARIALLLALALPFSASAEITGKVIKIGVLNDQSGLYADLAGQGSVAAAKMAAEDSGGKIGDATIEVIFADHQNKPDVGSNIARQWYDVDGVDV